MKSPRSRLDQSLVARKLAQDVREAQALIMAGRVSVDGERCDKAGTAVTELQAITIRPKREYVSRGALKLLGGLDHFAITAADRICADIGASTGGFTEVLLERGAARVYAIDVGYGDLAYALREDPRVVVMERTNVRTIATLPDPIDLVTCDVSFISLRTVLPHARAWLTPKGEVVALIKPQFEAPRDAVGEGGIVRDPAVHRRVLEEILQWCPGEKLYPAGLIPSPILGTEGNREFLVWLTPEKRAFDLAQAISAATA